MGGETNLAVELINMSDYHEQIYFKSDLEKLYMLRLLLGSTVY